MHGRIEISIQTNEILLRTFAMNSRILSEELEEEKTKSERYRASARTYKNRYYDLSGRCQNQGTTLMNQTNEINNLNQDLGDNKKSK